MSKPPLSKDAHIKKLARELVRDSIIEDAASRFVEMVLKEAHDSRIKPLQDRIEELEAKLAKAVEAARELMDAFYSSGNVTERHHRACQAGVKLEAARAEINGGGDE